MNDTKPAKKTPAPPQVKEAISSWSTYAGQAESLVHLTHEGLGRVQTAPKISEILYEGKENERDENRRKQEMNKAKMAAEEADSGFPNLHAHSLLGLWGAFECFVEDLVIAVLETRPYLLESPAFAKVRIPVSVFALSDSHERTATIFQEASKIAGSDMALGITKFERQLKLVNLDGPVPPPISNSIYRAQQIRNIWAHRGGKADARFIERCPSMGLSVGQRALMDFETFAPLMHGLHMYGMVIINRYLRSADLNEVLTECKGYKGTLTPKALEGPNE